MKNEQCDEKCWGKGKLPFCCKSVHRAGGNGGGMTYCVGLIGALVYFLQHAANFQEGVFGVLKALVWPALLGLQSPNGSGDVRFTNESFYNVRSSRRNSASEARQLSLRILPLSSVWIRRVNAKTAIIGSLLVIALADNISDTLGIHMYQESEGLSRKTVWLLTITNFLSRFVTSMGFVAIIAIFPLQIAVILSLYTDCRSYNRQLSDCKKQKCLVHGHL